jgi:hypothetical protein
VPTVHGDATHFPGLGSIRCHVKKSFRNTRRVSEIQVLKHDNYTNTTQGKKLNDYFMQVAEVKLNRKVKKIS